MQVTKELILISLLTAIMIAWNSTGVLASECDNPKTEWTFYSCWDTATGTSTNALQDGGKWDDAKYQGAISVVANGPSGEPDGGNVFKIDWEGLNLCSDCSDGENGFVEYLNPLPNPRYMRIYFYSESPGVRCCSGRKFFQVRDGDGSGGGPGLYLYEETDECSGPEIWLQVKNFNFEGYNYNTNTARYLNGGWNGLNTWPGQQSQGCISENTWHIIEFAVYEHPSNGWVKVWLDGLVVINTEGASGFSTYDTSPGGENNMLQIPSFRNGGTRTPHSEYFDNFVISTSYIGLYGEQPEPECTINNDCSGGQICCNQYCIDPPSCPNCDDGDSCTTDSCVGQGTCNPTCQNVPITACVDDDCCPAGCTPENDIDCQPTQCENDQDGDGYGTGPSCLGPDCNDNNPNVNQTIQCLYDGSSCGQFDLCLLNCPIPPTEICDNTQDDDCDNLPDCLDSDCSGDPSCQTEKTISVDSTYPGYTTDTIDDDIIEPYGGEQTTWASEDSDTEPHWVRIDFSSPLSINTVTIHWAYNDYQEMFMSSQEVRVQYWDGSGYVDAATITNTEEAQSSTVTFPEMTTSSLRLWQPADMGPPTYSRVMWLTEVDYSSQATYHRADNNPQDGCIDLNELLASIVRWKVSSRDVRMPEVMEAIGLWKGGTGC